MIEGIMVVDKPKGLTSHDVVYEARRKLGVKKIGHAGTLDPLATGVLVILVGRSATKLSGNFLKFSKAYRSTMILGLSTDSADVRGKIMQENDVEHISKEDVETILNHFRGEINQIPPMFSALKHNGKKLYQLARKGITIDRKPRKITVSTLRMEDFNLPEVKFFMECSSGTYVRKIAEDIGNELGCGACISQIRRTKVGPFTLDEAIGIEDIHESFIRDWKF